MSTKQKIWITGKSGKICRSHDRVVRKENGKRFVVINGIQSAVKKCRDGFLLTDVQWA